MRDGAELDEGDVTITEMIQDGLDRLETQQTKDFYEQPDDSGAITKMTATLPQSSNRGPRVQKPE